MRCWGVGLGAWDLGIAVQGEEDLGFRSLGLGFFGGFAKNLKGATTLYPTLG